MMWTALAIRLFAVISVTVPVTFKAVKLERRVRSPRSLPSTGGVPGDAGVVDQVGSSRGFLPDNWWHGRPPRTANRPRPDGSAFRPSCRYRAKSGLGKDKPFR